MSMQVEQSRGPKHEKAVDAFRWLAFTLIVDVSVIWIYIAAAGLQGRGLFVPVEFTVIAIAAAGGCFWAAAALSRGSGRVTSGVMLWCLSPFMLGIVGSIIWVFIKRLPIDPKLIVLCSLFIVNLLFYIIAVTRRLQIGPATR